MAIFGYARSKENYISYEALEEIKDGLFFSGKYESGMVCINPPHVVVLCNFAPDESKLSKDRWVIKNIDHDYDGRAPRPLSQPPLVPRSPPDHSYIDDDETSETSDELTVGFD